MMIKNDPAYQALAKKTQRSFGTALLYYQLSIDGPLHGKIAANPDVRRLATMLVDEANRDFESLDADEWVLVRAMLPDQASKFVDRVKTNEWRGPRMQLRLALAPYHSSTGLDEYWSLILAGNTAGAKKAIEALANRGVPVP